ncbi:MAG: hypothetical protein HC898_02055 [Phycisphaerales bacterium]|nr:hypothetical protein [Phycisphaerales bacterium]
MLALGAGNYFDILTVHSLYAKAVSVQDMRSVLKKHGLPADMPVWSTEPKHVLPMRNFAADVQKNMHFLLVNPGAYASFQNLSERDGAAAPWGVAYALAARHLGAATFKQLIHTGLPDVELGLFDRAGQMILAATADQGPRGSGVRVQVKATGSQTPRYVDLFGHEREVPAQGTFIMPLDRSGILYGAAVLDIQEILVGESTDQPQGLEISADQATLKNGFMLKSDEARGAYAVVYRSPQQADGQKPTISFPFTLESAGTYEFYVSAMWYPSHAGALVSPFHWSIDNRPAQPAPADATVHWRRSTRTHLRFGQVDPTKDANITAVQTFARLGTARRLTPGQHTMTLELQAPRAHDGHFSMEVQMVAVRPIADDGE